MSVPQELETIVQKVLTKKGFPNVTIRDSVYEEVLSDEDVVNIAQIMGEWQTYLPTLGIPLQDGADIMVNITLLSPLQKRIAVLTKFTQLHGVNATYKKLILAFHEVKRNDLVSRVVERVAERLKRQIPEDSSAAAVTDSSQASRVQSTSTAIKDKPTFPSLVVFRCASGRNMNILNEIGADYHDFGIILLNDDNGTVIASLIHKNIKDPKAILQDIFKLWLEGRGKPVSWQTLVTVLTNVGLVNLAQTIGTEKL